MYVAGAFPTCFTPIRVFGRVKTHVRRYFPIFIPRKFVLSTVSYIQHVSYRFSFKFNSPPPNAPPPSHGRHLRFSLWFRYFSFRPFIYFVVNEKYGLKYNSLFTIGFLSYVFERKGGEFYICSSTDCVDVKWFKYRFSNSNFKRSRIVFVQKRLY